MKLRLLKTVLSLVLAGTLAAGEMGTVFATGISGANVSSDKAAEESAIEESVEAKRKEELYREYLEERASARGKSRAVNAATSTQTMIKNDYLEFMVGSDGRFTIGNIEGNPDYTSDNNQILLYGHSNPWSSFSTVRLRSSRNETVDLIFESDNNTYDTEAKTVVSVMDITGSFDSGEAYDFTVTQRLQFVKGSRGLDDTVKIGYTLKNNGRNRQKAGIRIMIDTMLADHDDATFKAVGYGNVISELEVARTDTLSTYQVYDDLENPTTFATGTLYLEGDRIPDRVQFARWSDIDDTLYDYETKGGQFGDSAVAIYFDPVDMAPSESTDVCTYYGVNSNLTSEGNTGVFENIDESQYGVLVYDSLLENAISGATVTIGSVSKITDSKGLAVFDNYTEYDGKNVTVKVEMGGYKTTETQRTVLCGSFTGIGVVSEDSTSEEPSALSVTLQSGATMYDLLTTYMYYDEAKKEEEEKADDSIQIRVSNAGTADIYRLVQAGSVKYESVDGTFTIPVVTKDASGNVYERPRVVGLSAGKLVKLQMINSRWGTKNTDICLRILAPTFTSPDSKKGSVSFGDKITFTVPDSVPVFGGTEMSMGVINPTPVSIDLEDSGKVRIAIGGDPRDLFKDAADKKDAWDKFESNFNEMKDLLDKKNLEALKDSDISNLMQQLYGAGPVKFSCKISGYGEGVVDSNGNVNIEVGCVVTVSEEKSYTHYFFISAVPVYLSVGEKGELALQLKGNFVYGDGNFSFAGGEGTFNPSFTLSVEGGVGVKGAVSVSAEGSAKLKWLWRFSDRYHRVSLSGAIAVKLKILLFEAKKSFDSSEATLYEGYSGEENSQSVNLLNDVYNEMQFELSDRETASGVSAYSLSNYNLESMYTDVREMTAGGVRYQFYLANDAERANVNRTVIVYRKYIDGEWTDPVPLDNDGTADISFALVTDGNDIFVAWENESEQFDEDVTLTDMIKSCRISLCKLETTNDTVTKLYTSPDDSVGDFLPAVTVTSDGKIRAAWYSNSSNNVYGNAGNEDKGQDSIYYVDISRDGAADNGTGGGVQEDDSNTGNVKEINKNVNKSDSEETDGSAKVEAAIGAWKNIDTGDHKIAAITMEGNDDEGKNTDVADSQAADDENTEEVDADAQKKSEKDIPDSSDDNIEQDADIEQGIDINDGEKAGAGADAAEGKNTDVPESETKIEVGEGRVVSLSAGRLDGKDSIIYSVDGDGDFNTEDDIALYAYADSASTELAAAGMNTNAKFTLLDGRPTIFFYSAGNIAYTSRWSGEDIAYVLDEETMPLGLSDKFTILADRTNTQLCILWKNANDERGEDIYAVNYQNGGWSKPYVLTTIDGTDVSIPSGFIDEDGSFVLTYGYMGESGPVAETKVVERYTDIALDHVMFDQENVSPGSDMDFDMIVSNKGLQDVENIVVEVSDGEGTVKRQEVEAVLGVGSTQTCKVSSAFTVPEDLSGVKEYTVKAYAADENNMDDNEQTAAIGYTDVSVEENGRYMAVGDEYIALKVRNNSGIAAKNVRLKVLADSEDGVVIYDTLIGTLEARAEKIYNVNINQLLNSTVAYALITTDSEDFRSYNNTELLAVNPYLSETRNEIYKLFISSDEGGRIVGGSNGNYEAGAVIPIKAEADPHYKFAGWEATVGEDGFEDAAALETTFTMPDRRTEITAKWERIVYKVSFELQGHGTARDEYVSSAYTSAKSGMAIKKPADPVEAGYTFFGWYKDADCTQPWDFSADTVTADTALYAKWEKTVYHGVTFSLQDHGTALDEYTSSVYTAVESGKTIKEPTAPADSAYVFKGWYKDTDCTQPWDFSTDTVTADTTLYAKWEKVIYSVTFDLKGHGTALDEYLAYTGLEPGSMIKEPAKPDAEAYIFTGWYKDASCKERWDFETDTVDGNITLYAGWEIDYDYDGVLPIDEAYKKDGFWVAPIKENYVYIGKPVKVSVRVYYGDTRLKEKINYTVKYKNNTKAYEGSLDGRKAPVVTIKGKGQYRRNTEKQTFLIYRKDLADGIAVQDMAAVYNGKVQTKVPALTYGGKKLSKNKDFTYNKVSFKEEGTYTVQVQGVGNFKGTTTVNFIIINKKEQILMNKVTVSKIKKQSYQNGAEIKPSFTVKMKKAGNLTENVDYTAEYYDNTKAGTATIILRGKGKYAGTKMVTFKIK